MKFHKHLLVVVCCMMLFLSCGSYGLTGDYYEELSGDYFYRDEGSDMREILSHSADQQSIYSTVLEYKYNREFIVMAQQPNYKDYKIMVGFELRCDTAKYPKNSAEDQVASEKIADSILKHDPYYLAIFAHKINFWIIANKEKKLYGPLTKDEYLLKVKALKIPGKLLLDEANAIKQ